MSVWTHVCGGIRVDGLPGMSPKCSVPYLKELIGPVCKFDNWQDSTTLPCGSEGSLQYEIIEYDKGFPWVYIPVWGDLRDYDNTEAIKIWWTKTLELIGHEFIRDAVLRVEVEGKPGAEIFQMSSSEVILNEQS